ncbi:DNA-3-methyladenine glycosylase [Georgenia yuyongxinii]|uniref:Putative 3-methyladenine DNA glycosylase n=1 Tax=Georgenia yuyongxinii TaxID=2589797 RepID=A0A5B8C2M0_9MICO|nr:DNA-3-methyladenine glycosylase [Georgenia yuyongxinii]QDC24387.1 DNA-3-methyladenine glycosylase [Georgenia yuyongxinii]
MTTTGPDQDWAELLCRPSLEVAPRLLGSVLTVRGSTAAATDGAVALRLTEVEAYNGEVDPGSHAYRGLTPRTAPMFAAGGRLYVYFTYGMHWCANIVCGPEGSASAVLLRGGEVVAGHRHARARRPAARTDRDLARGPARLAQALGLTGADSGLVLRAGGRAELQLGPSPDPAVVRHGPRVGVAGPGGDARQFPWRYWLDGEPTVSVYRPAAPRRR